MLARLLILLLTTLLSTTIFSDWVVYPFSLPWAIHKIEMRNPEYGWLVGVQFNQIAKWDGSSWQQSPASGVSIEPYDISATDDNNAWAVGLDGVIAHYETDHWTAYPSPTTYNLYDICMINSSEGWAVGNSVILHYSGDAWTVYTQSGLGNTWHAVWGDAPNNIWIGGFNGRLAHWDGVTFTQYTAPTDVTINGIWFADETHGYACANVGYIFHWNGSGWEHAYWIPSVGFLFDICLPSTTEGWCVGTDNVILQYDGTQWQTYTAPTGGIFTTVSLCEPGCGFIGGTAQTMFSDGIVISRTTDASVGEIKAIYH